MSKIMSKIMSKFLNPIRAIACSKLAIEKTLEKGVKYVQS